MAYKEGSLPAQITGKMMPLPLISTSQLATYDSLSEVWAVISRLRPTAALLRQLVQTHEVSEV